MTFFVRRFPLLFCLVATTALCTVSTRLALAEDQASVEMARQRFREGVEFYDQREYEKARLAFLQAYALKPHPSVLLNLAQSELRSGHPADAANHFALFLRQNPDRDAPETQEAELGFAAARSKSGAVFVEVDVSGADIFVDGEKKAESPLSDPIYVPPGQHTLEARIGSESQSQTVRVGTGQSETVSLVLKAISAPGMASDASEDTNGTWSDAGDDGTVAGSSSSRQPLLPWMAENPPAILGAGLAVVGLGAGIAFAVLAKNEFDKADEMKTVIRAAADQDATVWDEDDGPCMMSASTRTALGAKRAAAYDTACASFDDAADTGQRNKTLAAVSFVVAGASAVGTAVYYIVDSSPDRGAAKSSSAAFRPRLMPIAGPNVQGLSLIGQF